MSAWNKCFKNKGSCGVKSYDFFGKLRKIPLTFDHVQYFQETFYHERMLQDQRKSQVKLTRSHKQKKIC